LVRAEPDELPVVAPELARSLIHCKVPIWATAPGSAGTAEPPPAAAADKQAQAQTPKGVSSSAEVQRQRALVAVLSASPLTSGDTVIAELYSPNLDQHQRVLILDGLAAAAAEMSDPRKAPQLALQGPQAAPELLPPAATAGRVQRSALPGSSLGPALPSPQQQQQQQKPISNAAGASSAADSADGGKTSQAAPGLVESSSRVWGKVSLQKQAAAAADPSSSAGRRTFRNRFAPVALRWTAALLQQCDVKQQGVDLFGRDSLLLGRLLTVLGSFVEAAAETPAAVPLCAGLLELLKAQEVSGHKEVGSVRARVLVYQQHPGAIACWFVGQAGCAHSKPGTGAPCVVLSLRYNPCCCLFTATAAAWSRPSCAGQPSLRQHRSSATSHQRAWQVPWWAVSQTQQTRCWWSACSG
jgi:telomere length regulation protein